MAEIPEIKGTSRTCQWREYLSWSKLADFLLLTEPAWVFLAGCYVLFSVLLGAWQYSWLGLLIAALSFPLRRLKLGYFSLRTPFDLPVALFVISMLIGLYISPNLSIALGAFQTGLTAIILYYSIANYPRPLILAKGVLIFSCLCALGVGLFIFAQKPVSLPFLPQIQNWIHLPSPPQPANLTKPLFAAPATGATVVLETVTMILLAIALFSQHTRNRVLALIAAIPLLITLLLSASHATWLVFSIGVLFLLCWRSVWALLSIPAWLGVVYWSLYATSGYSWAEIHKLVASLSGRLGIWTETIHLLAERPLTGWGLGSFLQVFPARYGTSSAHNAYLQIGMDLGLLGIVALVWAAMVWCRGVWQLRQISPASPGYALAVGLSAAILTVAVYGFMESSPASFLTKGINTHYYAMSPIFWILAGFWVGIWRFLQQSLPNPRQKQVPHHAIPK